MKRAPALFAAFAAAAGLSCGHPPLPADDRAVELHVTGIPAAPPKGSDVKPIVVLQIVFKAANGDQFIRCPKPPLGTSELTVFLQPAADGPASVQAMAFDTFYESTCSKAFDPATVARATAFATGDVMDGKVKIELPLEPPPP
jgi:hypothetical protein